MENNCSTILTFKIGSRNNFTISICEDSRSLSTYPSLKLRHLAPIEELVFLSVGLGGRVDGQFSRILHCSIELSRQVYWLSGYCLLIEDFAVEKIRFKSRKSRLTWAMLQFLALFKKQQR